jgi:carboxylate-amine ligase
MPDFSWNTDAGRRPWTVGIEEEVLLLDADTWMVANRGADVLALMGPRAAPETHDCVVELRTAPHAKVGAAAAELSALRQELERTLGPLGLRAGVAGTHPFVTAGEVVTSGGPRYREVEATMRGLAHREPTMAQHVHVAVPDAVTAVRVLDALRAQLPVLLALSANSPFWAGRDSGFASMRAMLFAGFPRTGIPRRFGHYGEYTRTVWQLVHSGAIPDPQFLWWDARLQPRLGTVEVRVMDAQTRLPDAAALAALVQCLVVLYSRDGSHCAATEEVLDENRFLAARDGLEADLVDVCTLRRRAVRELLADLLTACAPVAARLGCADELAAVDELAADTGDARQRRRAAEDGLVGVTERLCEEFSHLAPGVPA